MGEVLLRTPGLVSTDFRLQQSFATLTLVASVATPNMSTSNNFTLTLAGTDTLANPTNKTVGQSGVIVIRQPAAGGKTLAFGTHYLFTGGVDPTIPVAANAVCGLSYTVMSATEIWCTFEGGLA
jgi:hypothetical protein